VAGGGGRDNLTSRITVEEGVAAIRNTLDGGAGNDVLRASVAGPVGADIVQTLYGRQGNDTLIALSGSHLQGGIGNDRSIGSAEVDTFMFDLTGVPHGHDVVEQFDRTEDILALNGFGGNVTVTDDGADVLAAFANGASILFKGVGTGAVDSLLDLVDDAGQIVTDWSQLS
jgi:Ca2+-binding RTX toxin-like protein